MWITLFAIAMAISIGLTVAAVRMHDRLDLHRRVRRRGDLEMVPAGWPRIAALPAQSHQRGIRALQIVGRVDRAVARLQVMSTMMERLGFYRSSAPALAELDLNAVVRTCQKCTAEAACRSWLADAGKEAPCTAPPFCPNAGRFERAINACAAA